MKVEQEGTQWNMLVPCVPCEAVLEVQKMCLRSYLPKA